MPNFTYGFYKIKSTKENIDKIIDNYSSIPNESSNILNTILPVPDEHKESSDWRINNWGCKWDIDLSDDIERIDDNNISFHGRTPWSPPANLINTVAKDYDIEFIGYTDDLTELRCIKSNQYHNVIYSNEYKYPDFIKEHYKSIFGSDFFDDLIDEDIDPAIIDKINNGDINDKHE